MAFIDQKTDDAFVSRDLHWTSSQGADSVDPMQVLLTHFFNHQTHHRGQVHDMLSQTDVAPPSLDLHRIMRPV